MGDPIGVVPVNGLPIGLVRVEEEAGGRLEDEEWCLRDGNWLLTDNWFSGSSRIVVGVGVKEAVAG